MGTKPNTMPIKIGSIMVALLRFQGFDPFDRGVLLSYLSRISPPGEVSPYLKRHLPVQEWRNLLRSA